LVVKGQSPASLIDSYDRERVEAAQENILHSTRATDFIAPRSPGERVLRDAALALAGKAGFARGFVNSGRLSQPTTYLASPLSTPGPDWQGGLAAGTSFHDAALPSTAGGRRWLSETLAEGRPVIIACGVAAESMTPAAALWVDVPARDGGDEPLARRYGLTPGDAVVLRPDGHVAARFRQATPVQLAAAIERLEGRAAA